MLGERLVDRHDRVAELPIGGHGAHPDDPGGRLLGAPDHTVQELCPLGVQGRHQVSAVVHGHVRSVVEGRSDVPVVRVAILALDGVSRDAVVDDQGRRHVIVGRERVARAEDHVRPAGREGAHQICCFRGDVQTRADPPTLERVLCSEAFADAGDHRHLAIGPFDLPRASLCQADVGDVVLDRVAHLGSRCHVSRIASRMGRMRPHPPERRRPSRSTSWQYSRYPRRAYAATAGPFPT